MAAVLVSILLASTLLSSLVLCSPLSSSSLLSSLVPYLLLLSNALRPSPTLRGQELQIGLLYSGMTFYLYNELATLTIKSVGPVASSVANTAKRVIVMVYMSMFVTFKPLTTEQQIGSAVAITFVMLYAVVDIMIAKITGPAKTEKKIN